MGRLKLYGGIAGLVFLYFGFKGAWDNISSEKEPFKMTIADVEKNGVGDHKYVRITDTYAPGTFVYSYSTKHGVKGKVNYIIYPVVSMGRLMEYAMNVDSDGNANPGAKLKSRVIVKTNVDFPYSEVNSYKLDTGLVAVEGMVRSGFDGMSSEDKNLLKDDALDMETNFIYIVKEKPEPWGLLIVAIAGGLALLYFALSGFINKKPLQESAPITPTA